MKVKSVENSRPWRKFMCPEFFFSCDFEEFIFAVQGSKWHLLFRVPLIKISLWPARTGQNGETNIHLIKYAINMCEWRFLCFYCVCTTYVPLTLKYNTYLYHTHTSPYIAAISTTPYICQFEHAYSTKRKP